MNIHDPREEVQLKIINPLIVGMTRNIGAVDLEVVEVLADGIVKSAPRSTLGHGVYWMNGKTYAALLKLSALQMSQ